jgi:hypothetical protein
VWKRYAPATEDRQLLQFGTQSSLYGDVLVELTYPLRLLGRSYREPIGISLVQDDYTKDIGFGRAWSH